MGWFKDWREKRKLKKQMHKKSEGKYESTIKEIDALSEKRQVKK